MHCDRSVSIVFYRLHECDKLRLGVQPSVVSYGTAMLASNRLGHWEAGARKCFLGASTLQTKLIFWIEDALALLDELRSLSAKSSQGQNVLIHVCTDVYNLQHISQCVVRASEAARHV